MSAVADVTNDRSIEGAVARRPGPVQGALAVGVGVVGAIGVISGTWWILIAGVAGLIGSLLTLAKPVLGIFGLVVLGPEITSYARLSLPSGIPDLTVPRLAVGLVATSMLVSFHLGLRGLRPIIDVEKAMLGFIAVVYLDLFIRVGDVGSQSLELLDEFVAPFLLFYLTRNLFRARSEIKKFCYAMALSGVVLASHGAYQFATHSGGGQPMASASGGRSDTGHVETGRATGPFDNAAEYGCFVSFAFLWTLFLVLHESRGLERFALLIALGVIGMGALLSLGRAIWLALALAVLLIAWLERRWRFAIVVCCLAVVVVGAVGVVVVAPDQNRVEDRYGAMGPIYMRVVVYRAALTMFLEKPILGYGRGERTFVVERQDHLKPVFGIPAYWGNMLGPPHNSFLFTLVQWGLVGLVFYVSVIYFLLRRAWRVVTTLEENSLERRLSVIFLATSVIFLTQAMFADSMMLLYLSMGYFIGAGVALARTTFNGAWPPSGKGDSVLPAIVK